MIFECVINISEGKDTAFLSQLADLSHVIDVHSDEDHHRSVATVASHSLADVIAGTHSVLDLSFSTLTLDEHNGVHPLVGIVDVVPFVSYSDSDVTPTRDCIAASRACGEWIFEKYSVPVFTYDAANDWGHTLPHIRKHAFSDLTPTWGEQPHPHWGAVCVGAREPLIAINVNLETTDISHARDIARDIRESSGGIPGVRALGFSLEAVEKTQVSMNIVDTVHTKTDEVCLAIRDQADAVGIKSEVELVGCVPGFHFEKWSDDFLTWSGLDDSCTVESLL